MSSRIFDEHRAYWLDAVKLDLYRRALAEVVTPETTVLDLGSGTGLLALLACEAGAARVYSVESGPIAAVAQEVFERNGVADRVELVRGSSTDIDLPERVDIVVGDQIGGLAYSAGVFKFYEDAAERLLAPSGRTVPAHFELFVAGIEHEDARRAVQTFASPIAGFDVSALFDLARHQTRTISLDDGDAFVTAPAPVLSRSATDASRFRIAARLDVTRDGTLDGIVGMFVAEMSPTVTMSNVPGRDDKMERRWQDYFPLDHPVQVRVGDLLVVEMLVDPRSYLATWQVRVEGARDTPEERHSTFEGAILDLDQVRLLAGRPVTVAPLGKEILRFLGTREFDQLDPESLIAHLAGTFPSMQVGEIRRLVRNVAMLLSRGAQHQPRADQAPAGVPEGI